MKRQREIAETGEKTVHNMPLRVALSALGPVEVVIPFAGMLEGILPDNHIIMNTHHQRFLGYIQNSAALYQKQRKENDKGQIEADFEDYENAKLILKETTTNVLMIPLTKTQKAIIDSAKKMEWFSVREMEIEAHTTNKTIRLQLESHLNDFFETKIEDPDNDRGIFKPTKKYKLKQELIQESLELPSSEDVREGKIGFAKEGIDTNITKSIGIGCKEIIEEVVEVC